ncbi:putative methyl-accepting chemotaxis sensory transducer [Catenovulum agarivorans DS-2]|uniref:Putative methyl-accepting chemotaxis sensory transducer n=1 Tax=Catenovulum agarivorans DS-2 TaxID=1328313 RepID=W7QI02_9ALTE|nr:methyl-accepting chemotaxis protein [Catenovulum agarivorans]EWH08557.1 putative methyl-accepting chemotaxis sensory transducer [Catenovulum agarivorans DS-2]
MQFLKQFKIQSRIAALVLIPLVFTFILSWERLNNALESQQDMADLDIVLNYADVTSPYIGAVLEEAFYSRLYIDAQPDEASSRKSTLKNVRDKAKRYERTYVNYVRDNKDDLSKFTTLQTHINGILKLIEGLEYVRKTVDDKSHISKKFTAKNQFGRELHTMWELSVVIRRLLLSMNEIVVLSSANEQLSKMANAYYNLMAANVETSFHNSFVYLTIYQQLDAYIFGEIYASATKTNSYHELFLNFASDKAKNAFNKMRANRYYKTYDEVGLQARSNIYNIVNKPLAIDPSIDWNEVTSQVFKIYNQTVDDVMSELIDTKNTLVDDANSLVIQTIVLMFALLIVISLVSYVIARSIASPLKSMVRSFKQLAKDKDMTQRLDDSGSDELAELSHAFNELLENFNQTLTSVQTEANAIHNSSTDINSAMSDSLELSKSQLASTDSVSVAITEMTATISEVASMAHSTSDIVHQAHDLSVDSAKNAHLSRELMQDLIKELGNTGDVVNNLNEESKQISNILNVIQDIAEQTNLLALNAAIEAARAGDMGRGFAVVSDEVRNLASRTQESTKQIRQQIEALQQGAATAVSNMEMLQQAGTQSSDIVLENSKAFDLMKGKLDEVMQMATQIATATEEQTSVSNEMNERILVIRDEAQKVTDQTNKTSDSSQGLKQTGERLKQYISEFHL